MEGWHPAFEEYTETIFELGEDSVEIIQARIAERLEVSRPAVSEMIRRMVDEGLVSIEGKDKAITLTETGRALAERTVRRHRIAERFLTDILGLPWEASHDEAGRWEHVISDQVEKAMLAKLDNPTTCPHGNPIPGAGYESPDMRTLAKLDVGATFRVERIPETLEFEEGMLEYLENAGIKPGESGEVTASSPDGTVTVLISGRTVGLGSFASGQLLVVD